MATRPFSVEIQSNLMAGEDRIQKVLCFIFLCIFSQFLDLTVYSVKASYWAVLVPDAVVVVVINFDGTATSAVLIVCLSFGCRSPPLLQSRGNGGTVPVHHLQQELQGQTRPTGETLVLQDTLSWSGTSHLFAGREKHCPK